MVKMIYVFTRKPELSVEEFQRYWRETHAPIAARIPGVRRYVQCHVLPELYERENLPPYDGAAEVWFDDMDAVRALAMARGQSEEDYDKAVMSVTGRELLRRFDGKVEHYEVKETLRP